MIYNYIIFNINKIMNKLYNPSFNDISSFYKIINNVVYRVPQNYESNTSIEIIYKMEPLEYVINYRFYYINETYYLVVNYNNKKFPFFKRVSINLTTGKIYIKEDATILLHDIVSCIQEYNSETGNQGVYIFIGEWNLDGLFDEFKISINNDSNFEII